MPEDVPPAPEAVIEVQATFGGVTTDDAHDADFQEAIRAAVAEALDVDESQVGILHASVIRPTCACWGLTPLPIAPRRGQPRRRRPPLLSLLSLSFFLTHLPSPSRGHRVAGDHHGRGHGRRGRRGGDLRGHGHGPGGRGGGGRHAGDARGGGCHRGADAGPGGYPSTAWGGLWWLQAGPPILSATRGMSLTRAWLLFVCLLRRCLPAASRARATTTWCPGRSMPATPRWRSRKCP